FSPDGRWIAYWSNQNGPYDVYVRPFKGQSAWQISTGGGEHPTWSRASDELFYTIRGELWVARYHVEGSAFRADPPVRLNDVRFAQGPPNRMFDVHPDGRRFVLSVEPGTGPANDRAVVLVSDLFDQLRRVAPPK